MGDERKKDIGFLNDYYLNLQLHMRDKNYKAAWSDVGMMNMYLRKINRPDVYAKEEKA